MTIITQTIYYVLFIHYAIHVGKLIDMKQAESPTLILELLINSYPKGRGNHMKETLCHYTLWSLAYITFSHAAHVIWCCGACHFIQFICQMGFVRIFLYAIMFCATWCLKMSLWECISWDIYLLHLIWSWS